MSRRTFRLASTLLLALALTLSGVAFGSSSNAANAGTPNIVETAVAAGSFNTLVKAVKVAGLVDVLSGEGPFTVFAPTDEAFAALPEGALEGLIAQPEKLAAVLKHHVVAGKVPASAAMKLDSATTVAGTSLPISAKDGVMVGAAKVVQADIMASNGIIHVIDTVLLP